MYTCASVGKSVPYNKLIPATSLPFPMPFAKAPFYRALTYIFLPVLKNADEFKKAK